MRDTLNIESKNLLGLTALEEYARLAATIEDQLTRISDSLHDRVAPDEVNWCHVGDLGHVAEGLAHLQEFLRA